MKRLPRGDARRPFLPFSFGLPYLEIAKQTVGSGRLMWGSDLPSVIVNAPYSELIYYVADSGLFNEQELKAIYSENAVSVYGL